MLDWVALRLVPGGIGYLYHIPYQFGFELVRSPQVARFFDVRSNDLQETVIHRRTVRDPLPLTLPRVTRPLHVTAPPRPEEIADLLQTTNLVDQLARSWTTVRPPHGVPTLPLRTGHPALQLACGDFDGEVTRVDGTTTTGDALRVVITAVDASGRLTTLMGGSTE